MQKDVKTLAHWAGCIRKKYKLTPYEAAWCALWLAGEPGKRIPGLAEQLINQKGKGGPMPRKAERRGPAGA